MYAIVRLDGKYVAKPGSKLSYTDRLESAQIYLSREDAESNKCPENERVIRVTDRLHVK